MNGISLNEVVPGVYFTNTSTFKMGTNVIQFLKDRASRPGEDGKCLKKSRICTHPSAEYGGFHEMLIVMQEGLYIRPHRHHGKGESFHVIDGRALFVVFDDSGQVEDSWVLSREMLFYHRVPDMNWHTIIPLTDFFVIHEVTEGPFQPESMEWATWAPEINSEAMKGIHEPGGNEDESYIREISWNCLNGEIEGREYVQSVVE